MSTVQLDLGEELLDVLGSLDRPVQETARELIVMELYREGRIAAGKAAELLGVGLSDFLQFASQAGAPYFDLTSQEWKEEFSRSEKIWLAVVSDSGPLIALERIQQLELLPALFNRILVPPAVAEEFVPSDRLPKWLQLQPVKQPPRLAGLQLSLGAGEREALSLSLELRASVLLVDDKAARRAAAGLGIPIIGTLGILVSAKRRGLLQRVRPHLDALQRASFYFAPGLYARILKDADEWIGNRKPPMVLTSPLPGDKFAAGS
jgi:uncharacterized protein